MAVIGLWDGPVILDLLDPKRSKMHILIYNSISTYHLHIVFGIQTVIMWDIKLHKVKNFSNNVGLGQVVTLNTELFKKSP